MLRTVIILLMILFFVAGLDLCFSSEENKETIESSCSTNNPDEDEESDVVYQKIMFDKCQEMFGLVSQSVCCLII